MRPASLDRKQLGPTGPAGILCAFVGLGLMLLAILLVSRLALIVVVLVAGILIGNAMAFGILWLWQQGKF